MFFFFNAFFNLGRYRGIQIRDLTLMRGGERGRSGMGRRWRRGTAGDGEADVKKKELEKGSVGNSWLHRPFFFFFFLQFLELSWFLQVKYSSTQKQIFIRIIVFTFYFYSASMCLLWLLHVCIIFALMMLDFNKLTDTNAIQYTSPRMRVSENRGSDATVIVNSAEL